MPTCFSSSFFSLVVILPLLMPPRNQKINRVALVILGEAAGEGPSGMAMVADTMLNRARAKGKSLEEIAFAPQQFSAAGRPDLAQFATQQPPALQRLAEQLVAERQQPDFQPSHPYQFYVTQTLFDNRDRLPATHWLRRMHQVGQIGRHVLLEAD